ncbi:MULTISPECIES: methylmalonyl Co-A mutase-associated GTPase MeaB [Nocardiaceae]|uniref:Putative lysine arginine ornithine transport system ATPase n=1 Tax=Rhodococcoides fascians D188 TaxID=1051973 RepID=G8JYY7_RHOFA|nr:MULTISPECIES: methylmalonyl Co-A mutase-associated GTPase MeaB [Rhodococcus]AET25258.1 putative lysine arginine ornithine transport system ATPase [Rhodococcus fascians D188]AMY56284.1 putative GTPase [Rhodococcus fascians D188]
MTRHQNCQTLESARQGNIRALAQLMTRAENYAITEVDVISPAAPDHPRTACTVIGLTGPPGVGKSTLISCLIAEYRKRGQRVAVLCFDPSSPITGGALLGDRIRMQEHSDDPGVFIRSVSSRGHLGGLSATARTMIAILSEIEFDRILIETVGTGQSEVEIASIADDTIVVLAPGAGDGIQMAKAGVLEIADLYVVNKADQNGVHAVLRELQAVIELGQRDVPIVTTTASRQEGAAEVVRALEAKRKSPMT